MIINIFIMYTDINGQSYRLCRACNKYFILPNNTSVKIEIFPTITVEGKTYEVIFPKYCYRLFSNEFLEEFTLHKLLHPTTNIIICKDMFAHCSKLQRLDLTNLNTENVKNMSRMFYCCYNIVELNVSNFNTVNVTNMKRMFSELHKLQRLNIANFNTKNVINVKHMFSYDFMLKELNLSNFNINNDAYLFRGCDEIKQLDVTNFNSKPTTHAYDIVETLDFILANYSHYDEYMIYDINCNNDYSNYN